MCRAYINGWYEWYEWYVLPQVLCIFLAHEIKN